MTAVEKSDGIFGLAVDGPAGSLPFPFVIGLSTPSAIVTLRAASRPLEPQHECQRQRAHRLREGASSRPQQREGSSRNN